jgi:hypothetical protein
MPNLKNSLLVTLDHSIYKVIIAEINRWIEVLNTISWTSYTLQNI